MTSKPKTVERAALSRTVQRLANEVPIYDIHTHLYDRQFGDLLLWGIDDLLTYHYLVAETFRFMPVSYDAFWKLGKQAQADLIWRELFIKHSPISEACRGVITTLNALGLDPRLKDLKSLRQWFANWRVEDYITRCFELSGVARVCMTNSPFDDTERPVWGKEFKRDERFDAALRIDPLLLDWPKAAGVLRSQGYEVKSNPGPSTFKEVRRFLSDWSRKIKARYLMVSLPPDFAYPSKSMTCALLEKSVLPHCRESGLPFAVMMGVRRAVNPQLALAGDGSSRADLTALENLCAGNPANKFLATILSRENQHDACVIARKFGNLHLFGCWWFMNIPSVIEEMARMRIELLGTSVTLQHSDARVLDQLIYKWTHSKAVITRVLADKYADLAGAGLPPTEPVIRRDLQALMGGEFLAFCAR